MAKRFEYMIATIVERQGKYFLDCKEIIGKNVKSIREALNEFGEDGWEIVQLEVLPANDKTDQSKNGIARMFYFKREIAS
jgi:hypothetical protein